MTSSFRVLSATMCDEVRREMDGRGIVIGATNRGPDIPDSEIVLPRLAFYIEAIAVDVEAVRFRFIEKERDEEVFTLSLDFPYKADALNENPEIDFSTSQINLQLMLNQQDLLFKSHGRYCLEFQILDEPWQEARTYLFAKKDNDSDD